MTRVWCFLAVLASSIPAMGGVMTTITDTQPIIDWPLCRCGKPLPASLDFALFDYSNQAKLCSLDTISVTLTMEDGDTALGNYDNNQLFLGLDGINTGLALNGFQSGAEQSLAFAIGEGSGLSADIAQQILDKLNEDGQLFASIIDASPNDNNVNLYSIFDTTLALRGHVCPDPIPEPAALAIWLVLGGGAAARVLRQRRSRNAT